MKNNLCHNMYSQDIRGEVVWMLTKKMCGTMQNLTEHVPENVHVENMCHNMQLWGPTREQAIHLAQANMCHNMFGNRGMCVIACEGLQRWVITCKWKSEYVSLHANDGETCVAACV